MNNPIHSAVEFAVSARKTGFAARQPHSVPLDDQQQNREFRAFSRERDVMTILLVSNDDSFRSMIRAYLEHVGFAVISCTDARRAPEIARSAQDPMLLLLDLSSGGSDALQIAVQLASLHSEMPAVIIAGPALADAEIEIARNHAWKLVRAPFRLPDLLATIQNGFDRNRLHAVSRPAPKSGSVIRVASFPARNAPLVSSSKRMALVRPRPEGGIPPMNNRARILSICDDDGLRYSRELLLVRDGYETRSVTSRAALSFSGARSFDIALICQSVDLERSAAITELLRKENPEIQIACVAPMEYRPGSRDMDLEVAAGPEPLLEAIRILCNQRADARKTRYEVSHRG